MLMKTNYRILVVDDMSSIHQDFKKILTPDEGEEYRRLNEMKELVSTAAPEKTRLPPFQLDFALQSGPALELVKKSLTDNAPYAVAFVDVQMPPGEDGVETIGRIWEIDKEVQTVICTAFAKYTWEDLSNRFGDSDRLFILKKPFDNLEVIQLACSLCKRWNLNRLHARHDTPPKAKSTAASTSTMDRLNDAMNILSELNNKLKSPQQ